MTIRKWKNYYNIINHILLVKPLIAYRRIDVNNFFSNQHIQ